MDLNKQVFNISISTSTILRFALLVALGVALYYVRGLLFVILISIVIATFVDAAARKFSQYKIPRIASVLSIYVVSIVIIGFLAAIIVPAFFAEVGNIFAEIVRYIPQENIAAIIDPSIIDNLNDFFASVSQTVPASDVASSTQALISSASGTFYTTMIALFGSLANLVLVFIISFYLSFQENGIDDFLKLIIPLKYEDYVMDLWRRTSRKIALWIRSQLLISLFLAVVTFAILSMLGIKYALLLSLLALICGLIPFGIVFATIPAVIAGFVSGGFQMGLIVLIVYVVLQQIEGYILTPLINKRVTGIPPLVVILALLIGAKLAGFWGLLLAMPVALLLMEISNDVESQKKILREQSVKPN